MCIYIPMYLCTYLCTYVVMVCQTVGPRDLTIGMHIQVDPGSHLVNVKPQGGGKGVGEGISDSAGPENWILTNFSKLPSYMSNHKVIIENTHVI